MGVFRFRRFSVVNDKSAMKVNTDGVLLGALMTVRPTDGLSLDIGTGTGTISLMAAQRLLGSRDAASNAPAGMVEAIEIDAPSAEETAENFRNSPWSGSLSVRHISLQDFGCECASLLTERMVYDHIFSNPPYFEETLKAPDLRRRTARHSDMMSYREILDFSAEFLSETGIVSLILPASAETDLCRHARMNGLFPFRAVRVRTTDRKPPVRVVAEFSRERNSTFEETVLTMWSGGRYSEEYMKLTSDFYLWEK